LSQNKREPCYLIALNAQTKDEKIKISPAGEFKGVDGRVYTLNSSDVVTKTKDRKIDIVLNIEHGWSKEDNKAAGWFDFDSLEAREDGIYANLETTDIGAELIEKKLYRYLSPEYKVARAENSMIVLEIVGVGLVNRPNVLDEALNKEETTVQKSNNTEIELQKEIQKLKEENQQLLTRAKEAKIDSAIKAGELMPKAKEFAMSLNGEKLDEFLALNKDEAKHLTTNTPIDTKEPTAQTDEELEVNRQLGLGE